ncbi:MAG TPA: AtpZ/AtpI family protein [Syntrophales bacterium]|jgi:ATP synthase protein I|nr:AtpZ/AtpI family protein [Syntrophales bacterium]HON22731.1 AtpZ/AtpI family protein [Syntrophales bacterium]HOU78746.1 AtpZ/AtpI family protein [Syntrophales bacterium]HPC33259.1 AtpZ/AtpI family protein [Syntrophales bacterium]HQG34667.1 AtpZ/AtpI family protein [Syntrophales bacterium]
MTDEQLTPSERRLKQAEEFTRQVGLKEKRRLKGKTQKDEGIWFGLGMFGIVGWSVAIPTLIGTALGYWIDQTWPSRFSWTLMLLILGVALGSLNAGYWVKKARENIIKD